MKKLTTGQKNLQAIGENMAAMMENPYCPADVEKGIQEHLCELGSVVALWHPRVLRAIYWILAEEAKKGGVDITQSNLVGQDIALHPEIYGNKQESVM